MKYVLGDLHGEYDKFMSMLKLINFREEDTLYVLGDCIDRGADGIKILQHIMNSPNMELIWGNHEKLMLDYLESGLNVDLYSWLGNGGGYTYVNYNLISQEEQTKLCNFIKSLPYYKIVDKYILVHAGIDACQITPGMTADEILESQEPYDLLWIREDFYNNKALDGYTIIFGHTPIPYIDENSVNDGKYIAWHDKRYNDKICIDCCASHSLGRLCCLRLEDLQEFYV